MNIVDIVIVALIGVSVLWGVYRGFLQTLLGLGGFLAALFAAYALSPRLVAVLQGNEALCATLANYTDAFSRVGDLELSLTYVPGMALSTIQNVLARVELPAPLDSILSYNMQNALFGNATVNEYVSQTIVSVALNVLCFLLCFAAAFIVVNIVVNLLQSVFHFPLLRQLDWLAGAVFGLARGALLVYVLFALAPILSTVIPFEQFSEAIAQSALAGFFQGNNFIISIMNGRL